MFPEFPVTCRCVTFHVTHLTHLEHRNSLENDRSLTYHSATKSIQYVEVAADIRSHANTEAAVPRERSKSQKPAVLEPVQLEPRLALA